MARIRKNVPPEKCPVEGGAPPCLTCAVVDKCRWGRQWAVGKDPTAYRRLRQMSLKP